MRKLIIFSVVVFIQQTCYAASKTVNEAVQLSNHGNYTEAAAKFQEAIKDEPKNASLYLAMGFVYKNMNSFGEAIDSLKKATELQPNYAEAYYSLALLYEAMALDLGSRLDEEWRKGFWKEAKEAWKKVLEFEKNPKKREVAKKHIEKISE